MNSAVNRSAVCDGVVSQNFGALISDKLWTSAPQFGRAGMELVSLDLSCVLALVESLAAMGCSTVKAEQAFNLCTSYLLKEACTGCFQNLCVFKVPFLDIPDSLDGHTVWDFVAQHTGSKL